MSEFAQASLVIEKFSGPLEPGEAFGKFTERQFKSASILAYSPEICCFAEWDGNSFITQGGEVINGVYEFRAFCAEAELRWVSGADMGRSVMLREDGGADSPKEYFALHGEYLLWGQVKHRDGRPELSEGRIGSLAMPAITAGLPKDSRAVLEYVEYFKPDRFGNLIFIDERLKGIRPE